MYTPQEALATATYKLRRMVAASSTFQGELGVSTQDEALPYVHIKDFDLEDERPVASILPTDFRFGMVSGGGQLFLRPAGKLFLYLAVDADLTLDGPVDQFLKAADFVGGVVGDVAALSEADQSSDSDVPSSELAITEINMIGMGETPEEDWRSLGRFWFAAYDVDWGIGV